MTKYIATETVPTKGEVITGTVLKEGKRHPGFVITDAIAKVRVVHVIESNYAPNGFYVIGIAAK